MEYTQAQDVSYRPGREPQLSIQPPSRQAAYCESAQRGRPTCGGSRVLGRRCSLILRSLLPAKTLRRGHQVSPGFALSFLRDRVFFLRNERPDCADMLRTANLTILVALLWALSASGMPVLQSPGGAPQPVVSISGGLSAPVIGRDEELRFWVTIENKTDADLSQVRLIRLPEGYSVKEICFFAPPLDPTPPQQHACAKNSEVQQGDI